LLSLDSSAPEADYEGWLTELVPTARVEVWEASGHMLRLVDPQRFAARVRSLLAEQPGAHDRAMSIGMDRGLEPIGGAWARGNDLATTCHDVKRHHGRGPNSTAAAIFPPRYVLSVQPWRIRSTSIQVRR
jgi:hypothetical protein